ncbi:LRR receptor-like serine/threonine-protein kinase RGI3 [Solanum dulcamara]|uniref:LRR receptor-like serine/threonine-protein kinase RGI3 n=1 Tax=Solanum dulcamara TaxID=45834 RepID=UPI002486AC3F|nr:LRR receptor-like serine/threonine-protein kinase RGI3 [Solanum dulcamara]
MKLKSANFFRVSRLTFPSIRSSCNFLGFADAGSRNPRSAVTPIQGSRVHGICISWMKVFLLVLQLVGVTCSFLYLVASSVWELKENFSITKDASDGVKVYRSKRQRVVALALPNLQLQGTISPSLANLSFLSVLNLDNNQLQGSIPASLFQHRRVQVISLAFNKLDGEMWKGPWYVPELRVFDLTNNSLTGIIPPFIGNATKMMNFSLSGNRVSGNIPKEVGNLCQLADLYLTDNQLICSIPAILFNISSLLVISLYNNSLSGRLLLDEGNIVSNLKTYPEILVVYPSSRGSIWLFIQAREVLYWAYCNKWDYSCFIGKYFHSENSLLWKQSHSGAIPLELGKLSNLRELTFDQNYNLIGQNPEAIFNISSLEIIDFSFNNLSGRIPTTTSLHLPNLKVLYLGTNKLEGEIPLFITNASKLEILELDGNFLTGAIPTNLGNLRELQSLFLYTNQLTNEPRERELRFFNSLANCRMLQYLQVGTNPLTGVLLNPIGNLSSTIENFYIADAHINGLILTSIGNISCLVGLYFQGNNLAGSIPSEIGKLKQLQGMYL